MGSLPAISTWPSLRGRGLRTSAKASRPTGLLECLARGRIERQGGATKPSYRIGKANARGTGPSCWFFARKGPLHRRPPTCLLKLHSRLGPVQSKVRRSGCFLAPRRCGKEGHPQHSAAIPGWGPSRPKPQRRPNIVRGRRSEAQIGHLEIRPLWGRRPRPTSTERC